MVTSSTSSSPEPVGKGTFGCAYYPPLTCKNHTMDVKYGNNKYIMKVMDDESAYIESKISNILKRIDPYQEHFLYVIPNEVCQLAIPLDRLITNCEIIKPGYKGYFMKYGGPTLHDIALKEPHLITLESTIMWLYQLLIGVKLLQSANIIHYDIKMNNITINSLGYACFIDFGISFIADAEWKKNPINLIDTYYQPYPLFHNVLSIGHELEEKKSPIDPIEYESVENKDIAKLTEQYEPFDPDHLIIDIIKKYLTNKVKFTKQVIAKNIFKVDVHSLGDTFYTIYDHFKKKFKATNKPLTMRLRALLKSMLNVDYDKQYDVAQALTEITSMINPIEHK